MKRLDIAGACRTFAAELGRPATPRELSALRSAIGAAVYGRPPRALDIVDQVAAAFRLPTAQLLGPATDDYTCRARWACFVLMLDAGLSPKSIGATFGRDRTQVRRGVRSLGRAMEGDQMLRRLVVGLRERREAAFG